MIYDAPLSDLLRQSNINTESQLMFFSNYRLKYCIDTGRIKGAYIVFYRGVPLYHCAHVTVPVSQYSSESEYNAEYNSATDLAHLRILKNKFLKKYSDVFPEQPHLIILDSKSAIWMDNNGKYTKHTIHIYRIINLVRNGEDCNFNKIVWC